ncbi:F0F1 ATP synthase subunit epsilon [Amylibacter sp.]|jgi:F-type H+-transporting ATPase subunit epsilon|nr:ATP synthase F1, epsilon subunit [Rhodobacterales bacterium HTCC2255]MBT4134036.1 F0F1 ATP synthase subunit epsilon [Rhodobacterales bacterium]MCO4796928.1 F0F1 ATP synthase subunit epsilon [Amylibacter sp.]MBT6008808.1 F0F1 ATP synthase subunit epsilon [Rhodobacterales bacterium]MBT6894415.1 F0F1 ATP synthase subunit epsilon [Rhodobacterales bacterium]|tara:strand:+ start:2088 stop:2477 length:390 start_codon:yes stop_codon:yes gene_type:complete
MATIQFDLVSPERKLASLEASEIQIPGSDGDFTAMAEHAPVLTTLKPGLLSVKVGNDLMEYIVTGGFVEISGSNASVLAEEALPRNEVDTSVIEGLIEKATIALEDVTAENKDDAEKRLADTKALLSLI